MSVFQRLIEWFDGPPGSDLGQLEFERLALVLPELFGYHIVYVGGGWAEPAMQHSPISHRVSFLPAVTGPSTGKGCVVCEPESLAIAADTVDVLILPHVLEFSDNPHKVLREVDRVLIGEGHLVLLGFNPWSLWGIWRMLLLWKDEPPWCGHFYGLARIRDWLSLLDFEIVQTQRFFFRPPMASRRALQRLDFMEKLGRHLWPVAGGAYMIVARKRIVPLTPVRMRWRARRGLIASGIAEPSARTGGERR
jgi:SAM-dependent methyltransferase